MSHEEVCSWLGLPPQAWPPDYYTLLGLEPGESDPERIEQQVHERLTRLRCHQLSHPDKATDGMNLLARAFSCLMDPAAKKAYDAALLGPRREGAPPPAQPAEPPPAAPSGAADPLAWLFGPWSEPNVRDVAPPSPSVQDWASAPPPPRATGVKDEEETRPGPPPGENGRLAPEGGQPGASEATAMAPADPLVEVAQSAPARRGLGTKRALYYRIARTRELLRAWEMAGRYVGQPYRRLTRSTEANELSRQLKTIEELLQDFPPLLGEAGQAGFYVVALARQPKPLMVPTFRMLLPSQREVLARDWRDGKKVLQAHGRFLRGQVRVLRRTTPREQLARAVASFLHDHLTALRIVVGLLILWVICFLALLFWSR